jgi:FtsP/CotA-like multicopper oxidase with cupredoxin domain
MTAPPNEVAENALSRRDLFRAAAGAMCVPLAAGSPSRAENPQASPDLAPIVLRAGRFQAGPDGHEKEVWGYDGRLPGPTIRAKFGQKLRIQLNNELGVGTTIHWHGMHQVGTWRMDGVGGVSQKPVPSGDRFVYEFQAAPAGTHWYHSHVGVQYGNGLFGALIVDDPEPIARYDREEVLQINDWFWEMGDAILAGLLEKSGASGENATKRNSMKRNAMKGMKPGDRMSMPDVGDVPFRSGLINGKGRPRGLGKSPLSTVEVKKGEVVRLRLINSSSTYALRFQVDGHSLDVIASDGIPVRPVTVDNLLMGVGETYDVLLRANQDGVHWIRAVTEDGNPILAILRYTGSSRLEPETGAVRWGPRALKLADLRSREPVRLVSTDIREFPFHLGGSMSPYRWSINGQYFPRADPLVVQAGEQIRCTLHNPTRMAHPFHLHGHSFHVLGKSGALNLVDPPLKDTLHVPAQSELVIQWKANNPGQWFFHCHIEWHLETGMARVWQVKPYE